MFATFVGQDSSSVSVMTPLSATTSSTMEPLELARPPADTHLLVDQHGHQQDQRQQQQQPQQQQQQTLLQDQASSQQQAQQQPQPPQRRRNQVARACERCRIHRIKCDNFQPCSNCAKKGGQCSNGANGSEKLATLPQAYREVENLKKRIQELELELRRAREQGGGGEAEDSLTTSTSHSSRVLPLTPGETVVGRNSAIYSSRGGGVSGGASGGLARVWEGIHVSTAGSLHATWFGPSSLFYFIGRMDIYLASALQDRPRTSQTVLSTASKLLDAATIVSAAEEEQTNGQHQRQEDLDLTPTEEEYFLGLFWQSYHTVYPILDEVEFKEHYQSLWTPGAMERRPSALVDIVLALCIQYGIARLPSSERGHVGSDAMTTGRQHYRRCQKLLASQHENPTVATLQCHILCAIYLCCGSLTNMADGACGLAVRTAYMLGLHLDPPASLPRRVQEMRRRLWWTLYILESKMSMKLGRPFLLPRDADIACRLPADDHDVASMSSSNFAPLSDECTWLTWTIFNTKLVLAARAAHTAIYYHEPAAVVPPHPQQGRMAAASEPPLTAAWDDPQTLESYAQALTPYTQLLENWADSVPSALTIKRKDGSALLKVDMSTTVPLPLDLQMEKFAPLWLRRQRLLLQLMYHNLYSNLCRPFISFSRSSQSTPVADRMAVQCANHAIMLTHLMYQVLCRSPSSSSLLAGWHEAFQWQWNAAITLVGFVLSAHPRRTPTTTVSAARAAVDLAIAVLESFGDNFAVPISVAGIVRDVTVSVDALVDSQRGHDQDQDPRLAPHVLHRDEVGENHHSRTPTLSLATAAARPRGVKRRTTYHGYETPPEREGIKPYFPYGVDLLDVSPTARMAKEARRSDNAAGHFRSSSSSEYGGLSVDFVTDDGSSASASASASAAAIQAAALNASFLAWHDDAAGAAQGAYTPSMDSMLGMGQYLSDDEVWSLVSSMGVGLHQ